MNRHAGRKEPRNFKGSVMRTNPPQIIEPRRIPAVQNRTHIDEQADRLIDAALNGDKGALEEAVKALGEIEDASDDKAEPQRPKAKLTVGQREDESSPSSSIPMSRDVGGEMFGGQMPHGRLERGAEGWKSANRQSRASVY